MIPAQYADDTELDCVPVLDARHSYALHEEIARGGMATVRLGCRTTSHGFPSIVAVKEIQREFLGDASFMAMFQEEVRLAGRVVHPNVVPVIDLVSSAGELFLVMEYVHGLTIAELMGRTRLPVPIDVACSIAVGVLHGLHAAHQARDLSGAPLDIIHRDITPQNVIVGLDGTPRILDFGIAQGADRRETTTTGIVKGKLAYVAPERLQRLPFDRRVDIYALAMILWEMLTGRRLFDRRHDEDLPSRILTTSIPPPGAVNPDVPPTLDSVVLTGLARDARGRFGTARSMAMAIEELKLCASATVLSDYVERAWGEARLEREARIASICRQSPTLTPERAGGWTPLRPVRRTAEFPPEPDLLEPPFEAYPSDASRRPSPWSLPVVLSVGAVAEARGDAQHRFDGVVETGSRDSGGVGGPQARASGAGPPQATNRSGLGQVAIGASFLTVVLGVATVASAWMSPAQRAWFHPPSWLERPASEGGRSRLAAGQASRSHGANERSAPRPADPLQVEPNRAASEQAVVPTRGGVVVPEPAHPGEQDVAVRGVDGGPPGLSRARAPISSSAAAGQSVAAIRSARSDDGLEQPRAVLPETSCEPPFYRDAAGIKHFKPACL